MEQMIEYDTAFHRLIVESGNNQVLVRMIEQLRELVLRFRYIYYDNFKRAEHLPGEHLAILQAIERGDEKEARLAADTHIAKLKEIVIKEGV